MIQYRQLTNLTVDPYCLKPVAQSWQVDLSRNDTGQLVIRPKYMSSNNELCGTVTPVRGHPLQIGYILANVTKGMNERCGQLSYHKSAENLGNIHIRDNVWATVSKVIAPSMWNELWIFGDTPVTLISTGLYTQDDWDTILARYQAGLLPTPFFAGDTDPR